MSARGLAVEMVTMRRLRVGFSAGALLVAVSVAGLVGLASGPSMAPDDPATWNALLAGMSVGASLVCPVIIAVMASRVVDAEHRGGGWTAHSTAGVGPGALCRTKMIAVSLVTVVATLGSGLLTAGVATLVVGTSAPFPLRHWASYLVCLTTVNLTLVAVHVILSALVDNQLVALAVGVTGSVVGAFSAGLPDTLNHLSPWGFYALIAGAGYSGDRIVAHPPPWSSVLALAAVAAVVVVAATRWIDTKEF